MTPPKRPIVWTIAGSDSGGGAGVQADLKTIERLGGHSASLITALTAQNSKGVSRIEYPTTDFFHAQWDALQNDLPPRAIKIGMIGTREIALALASRLKEVSCPVIVDPVLVASSGDRLFQAGVIEVLKDAIFPRATIITPNAAEAEALTGNRGEAAATRLLESGARSVLLKGGHAEGPRAQDLYCDGNQKYFLSCSRLDREAHGTGCTLSSALATGLAHGLDPVDAIIQAKLFVTRALRNARQIGSGFPFLDFSAEETLPQDFPEWTLSPEWLPAFAPLEMPLGFYPIVDSLEALEKLARLGVKTIQFRVKSASAPLDHLVQKAAELGRQFALQLFINDYWELAIASGAFGVHLGQEDLQTADLAQIQKAGLRLGLSTHCFSEMARAKGLRPSYVAIGPIYPTTLKAMRFAPQGLERLSHWRKFFDCPVVAIGGISLERAPDVLRCGVDGVSVVSDITTCFESTESRVSKWLNLINK